VVRALTPVRHRPTSSDDGLLDALDAVAADIASRKVSLLNPTARHGVVPTPFAPHKTRDGPSILRAGSSQSSGAGASGALLVGPPRRTARRLTWTDARDIAGRLEHVQIFDTRDAMAQCAGIAPESAKFAPGYSPVRGDDAVPFSAPVDAVPLSSPGASPFYQGEHPVCTLDDASRAAARRIAAQLLRHEAKFGDTRTLDSTERCGKMLKRRVTPGVAATVQGAAAAAFFGQRSPEEPEDLSVFTNARVVDGVHIDRHVTTAGDALLVYLVTATLRITRQIDACEASRDAKQRDVARLLDRGDALAGSVPSRRVSAALRALHREVLALIEARARLVAVDSCARFLREAVGARAGAAVARGEEDAEGAVPAAPEDESLSGGGVSKVRRARSRGGQSETDAEPKASHAKPHDMADAFFEVLALGGLLPREYPPRG